MGMLLLVALWFAGCATLNKTQKGAATGTVTGGAVGAIVGRASGNTALGAIIGAAVGGTAGALIGNQMDKQAAEIERTVPDAKVVREGEGIIVEFSSNVLFGYDESVLSYDAKTNLDKLVKVLNAYPDTNIEVQGHTDSDGSDAYNKKLSLRRARAVSSYLANQGISRSRSSVNGFGETSPKYDNSSENGRSQNRRVEFLITANEKMKDDAAKKAGN